MATNKSKAKSADKAKESIGILRAAEKAHVSVGDIPLEFLSDLGILPDQMDMAKNLNRKVIGIVYDTASDMAEAPGKLVGFVAGKLKSDDKKATRKKPVAKEPVAKEPVAKKPAKTKPAAKAKAPAKPKTAAKPKAAAKPKVAAKAPAKSGARVATKDESAA